MNNLKETRKMIMVKAHEMCREMKAQGFEFNYHVQLGLNMKYLWEVVGETIDALETNDEITEDTNKTIIEPEVEEEEEPIVEEIAVKEPVAEEIVAEEPDEEEPTAVGNTDTGYFINAEGMICGLSGNKEVIKDGVLYFPEEGCSGIAAGALSDLGSAVEEIEIPANITNIQPGAFVGLSNLGWIEADEANPAYVTVDGVLYTADGAVLLAFPAAWTGTFQVPESVKSFAESAFDGTNLECIDARSCTLEQTGSIPETVKLLE